RAEEQRDSGGDEPEDYGPAPPCRNWAISRPAVNIKSSIPSLPRKLAIGLRSPNRSSTWGPTTTPLNSRPTTAGNRMRRDRTGTPKMSNIPSELREGRQRPRVSAKPVQRRREESYRALSIFVRSGSKETKAAVKSCTCWTSAAVWVTSCERELAL